MAAIRDDEVLAGLRRPRLPPLRVHENLAQLITDWHDERPLGPAGRLVLVNRDETEIRIEVGRPSELQDVRQAQLRCERAYRDGDADLVTGAFEQTAEILRGDRHVSRGGVVTLDAGERIHLDAGALPPRRLEGEFVQLAHYRAVLIARLSRAAARLHRLLEADDPVRVSKRVDQPQVMVRLALNRRILWIPA